MKKISVLIFATLMFLGSYGTVLGLTTVLYDDFNDGNLNPDWDVSFDYGAIGWTYTESGSNLTATDIQTQSGIQVPSGVRWPEVTLSRSFETIDDFQINFDISWDSYDDSGIQRTAAMQFLLVKLYDDTDNFLDVQSGYVDGWVGGTARQHAQINNNDYWSDPNSLPYSDSAHIEITRNSGLVEFFWDSLYFTSGINDTPLGRIDLVFGYDPYDGDLDGIPEAYFGRESIDMISVAGDPIPNNNAPVPEPSTMILLGTGLLGLAGWGRRKFKR